MARSSQVARRSPPRHGGRGLRSPHPTDIHVGKRIRLRRLYLDMGQQELGKALGLTFQQVQKYEVATNRVSASRLVEIARALDVPIAYFFDGLPGAAGVSQSPQKPPWYEWLEQAETIDLIRLYDALPDDNIRRAFLGMIKAVVGTLRDRPKGSR